MPVLILNSNGDGFRWGAAEATDGKAVELLQPQDESLSKAVLECSTHDAVLAFLDYHRDQLGDQGGITLKHDHHKQYIRHNLILQGPRHGVLHECPLAEMRAFVEQRKVDTNPKIKKRDRLATLIFSKSILEIRCLLLTQASVHVNFWGQRLVTFHGYEGSISLDRVAKELDKISKKRLEQGDQRIVDSIAGADCAGIVAGLYKRSDEQLKVKSLRTLITRIINWVREISFTKFTPRFRIEKGIVGQQFRAYTKKDFQAAGFPRDGEKMSIIESEGGEFFCPSVEVLRARQAQEG